MRVRVARNDEVVTYDVPYSEGMTVLDALLWVRENLDPSLAMRFGCRSANACKECVMVIRGRPNYACTTRLEEDTDVEPVPSKERLWDLAVDF